MTAKLSTRFFGLELKSPVIAASSSITGNVEQIRKLAKAGAGAVVLKSIFEEEIQYQLKEELGLRDELHNDPEYLDYFDYVIKDENLKKYTKLISDVKSAVDIPVVASVNCVSSNEWMSFAYKLQDAGADALELNLYVSNASLKLNSGDHEKYYFDVISRILKYTSVPVSVKISPYFSNLADMVIRLSQTGIAGISMFNRFYSPDIDINEEKVVSADVLSNETEYLLPLRWIGALSGKTACRLAGTTGIHSAETAIKFLLAGSSAVQVASEIYRQGPGFITEMNKGIADWMDGKGYKTISDFQGKLGMKNFDHATMYDRVQFMKHFGEKEY